MPIPKYFTHERAKALKEREKLLGQILAKLGGSAKEEVDRPLLKSSSSSLFIFHVFTFIFHASLGWMV